MLRPIGIKVIVEPDFGKDRRKGIVLPGDRTRRPTEGKVIAIGNDVRVLEIGDVILLPKYASTQFRYEGRVLYLFREADLTAKKE